MYRVSREGRRASSNSNNGADTPPRGAYTPPRGAYKERFANSASAYQSKSFSTLTSNRLFLRNPKAQLYLKIAAVVGSLFFLRGVRSAEECLLRWQNSSIRSRGEITFWAAVIVFSVLSSRHAGTRT